MIRSWRWRRGYFRSMATMPSALTPLSAVAKMTMYRHFRSKDELVAEVLGRRASEIAADLGSIVLAKGSACSRLRQVFEWYHDWVCSGSFFGCMFYRAASEYREREAIAAQVLKQRASLQGVVASLVQELGLGKRDAMEAANRICMLLDGALVAAVGRGDGGAVVEAWDTVAFLLGLRGTAARWKRS